MTARRVDVENCLSTVPFSTPYLLEWKFNEYSGHRLRPPRGRTAKRSGEGSRRTTGRGSENERKAKRIQAGGRGEKRETQWNATQGDANRVRRLSRPARKPLFLVPGSSRFVVKSPSLCSTSLHDLCAVSGRRAIQPKGSSTARRIAGLWILWTLAGSCVPRNRP